MNWELCRDNKTAIAYQVKHIYETGEDIPEVKSNLNLTFLNYGLDIEVIYSIYSFIVHLVNRNHMLIALEMDDGCPMVYNESLCGHSCPKSN